MFSELYQQAYDQLADLLRQTDKWSKPSAEPTPAAEIEAVLEGLRSISNNAELVRVINASGPLRSVWAQCVSQGQRAASARGMHDLSVCGCPRCTARREELVQEQTSSSSPEFVEAHALPDVPLSLDQRDIVAYMDSLYTWLRYELLQLFEDAEPPKLEQDFPRPGDRFSIGSHEGLVAVAEALQELETQRGAWLEYLQSVEADWNTLKIQCERLLTIRSIADRYRRLIEQPEIVADPFAAVQALFKHLSL